MDHFLQAISTDYRRFEAEKIEEAETAAIFIRKLAADKRQEADAWNAWQVAKEQHAVERPQSVAARWDVVAQNYSASETLMKSAVSRSLAALSYPSGDIARVVSRGQEGPSRAMSRSVQVEIPNSKMHSSHFISSSVLDDVRDLNVGIHHFMMHVALRVYIPENCAAVTGEDAFREFVATAPGLPKLVWVRRPTQWSLCAFHLSTLPPLERVTHRKSEPGA
jgi:hypothetical protein